MQNNNNITSYCIANYVSRATMLLFIQVSGLSWYNHYYKTSYPADEESVVVGEVRLVVHGLGAGVEMAASSQAVDCLQSVVISLFTLAVIAQI